MAKQYGLILKKKKAVVRPPFQRPNIFGDDSGDEGDAAKAKALVNETVRRESAKNLQSKQVQREMMKALNDDPTIYDYDGIYDAMQEKKKAGLSSRLEKDKKPKYIEKLKRAAEKRKIDYERMVERKAQREREKEGDEFEDKEAFVTTAYKEKMKRLAEEEEKEKKKDAVEAANDVMKQRDLSRFYHNLLQQNVSKGAYNVQGAEDRKDTEIEKRTEDVKKESSAAEKNRPQEPPPLERLPDKSNSDHGSDDESDRNSTKDDDEEPQRDHVQRTPSPSPPPLPPPPVLPEPEPANPKKITRRNTDTSVSAARERYLARKHATAAVANDSAPS